MRINLPQKVTFGYSKKLDNKLNKKLDESPSTLPIETIREVNSLCNKAEDEIVRFEGKNYSKFCDNEDSINFILDWFLDLKVWLCLSVNKYFPELNFLRKSCDEYDLESTKKSVYDDENGYPNYTFDDEDKKAFIWRDILVDRLADEIEKITPRYVEIKGKKVSLDDITPDIYTKEKQKHFQESSKDTELVRKFIPSKDSPKSLNDVVGLKSCIEDIEDIVIYPIEHPKEAEQREIDYGIKIPGFVLFHGAPGCGKTMLAEAICAQSGCDMFKIDISDVGSAYINESSQNIKEAYNKIAKEAKESKKPVIIFMDEIDSLLAARENGEGSSKEDNKIVNTLLPILNDAKKDNIIIIGATNAYNFLDAAVKDRVNFEAYIGLPEEKEIVEYLEKILKKVKMGETLAENKEDLQELAKNLKGYSPRSIKAIFEKAARQAARRQNEIAKEDFYSALENGSWEKINEKDYLPENKKPKTRLGFVAEKLS